jgi:oxygen-independent coproporphyrinogen-3 oxidase
MIEEIVNKQEPIGLYIHIPFCARKCNYCDFPSYSGLSSMYHDYTEALCKEISMISEKYDYPEVDTVFIGGGTPSVLPSSEIVKILGTLFQSVKVKKHSEITLEANPGTISKETASAIIGAGVNRFSVGLQAAQNRLLESMGRIHTKEMFIECINFLKSLGIYNINADIIFGLPGQSMKDWIETTDLVLKSDLSHISCYSLKIEEGTPWFEMRKKGVLPEVDEDLEREMYYRVISDAKNVGYHHYEISNFSKPGYECRHNLKYWTGKPYIGAGAAAHSFMYNERYANVLNPSEYISCIMKNTQPIAFSELIDPEERLSESLILGLRKIEGLSIKKLEREFGYESIKNYKMKIEMLEKKGLVSYDGDILKLTKTGLDYANLVWIEFI